MYVTCTDGTWAPARKKKRKGGGAGREVRSCDNNKTSLTRVSGCHLPNKQTNKQTTNQPTKQTKKHPTALFKSFINRVIVEGLAECSAHQSHLELFDKQRCRERSRKHITVLGAIKVIQTTGGGREKAGQFYTHSTPKAERPSDTASSKQRQATGEVLRTQT